MNSTTPWPRKRNWLKENRTLAWGFVLMIVVQIVLARFLIG